MRALAGATVRTARWAPLAPAAVVAALLVGWAAVTDRDGLWVLRAAMVLLVAGSAYVLDDPAANVTASAPVPLWQRRGLLICMLLGGVLGVWAVVLLLSGPVPAAALTLELLALLAVGWAVATGWGGVAAGPAVVALLLATARLPERWSLLAGVPGTDAWTAAHARWGLLLAAGLLALLWSCRDPAQSLRRTVTTRPSTLASSPGIGA